MYALSFFLVLFTQSAIAQELAAPVFIGSDQAESHVWVSTYKGQTDLDGIPVLASLEATRDGVELPVIGSTSANRAYRLTLTVEGQPSLRTTFALVPSSVTVNGNPHFAFVSDPAYRTDFNFVILSQDDGTLAASYTRRDGADDLNKGDFVLRPVPHIWRK